MRLFRKSTLEDSKAKAFLIYSDLRNLHIPRDKRLMARFPGIPAEIVTEWLKEFSEIDAEISRIGRNLTKDDFENHIKALYPFLNTKGVKQCQAIIQYSTDRGLW